MVGYHVIDDDHGFRSRTGPMRHRRPQGIKWISGERNSCHILVEVNVKLNREQIQIISCDWG